ncbi:MAG: right-handed parallel beta-helix repeat-containing protein, partial [Candidatus Heimdallarchaeota archaeon]|nr:right-handed parallel beta-helix repeat-containing protein [Candidatus Heimdallarchaeota archaeon]MCK4878645.1 right-handed parallel beta-helix repeat-containing protein [Candidatus Heimdallarchaeota archaeon]
GLVFTIFILLSGFFIGTTSTTQSLVLEEQTIIIELALTPHVPISIQEDSDFESYSFTGTGSESNPYIIDSLEIITANPVGILISNTSKYFEITNCFISADEFDIELEDNAEGTVYVYNNYLAGGGASGLIFTNSPGSVVENNIAFNGGFRGIHCINSPNSIFRENYLNNSHNAGLYVQYSNYILIEDNTAFSNEQIGIWISESSNSTVKDNYFFDNGNEALRIAEDSDNNSVYDNIFERNGHGIYIGDSSYNHIILNTLSESDYCGIKFGWFGSGSHYNLIEYNDIYHNKEYGVSITEEDQHNVIRRNKFTTNLTRESQALDDGPNNLFYDEILLKGNFWSDLGDNLNYTINGNAGNKDLYPLRFPPNYLDSNAPTIQGINDFEISEGETNIQVSWIISDNNPDNYTIYKNDEIITSGRWNDNQNITIILDDLAIGTNNITIIADDEEGNFVTDTVVITVTGKASFLLVFSIVGLFSLSFIFLRRRR